MSNEITRDTAFFAFSPDVEPVLHVKQGEEVKLTTHDCFSGQLKTTADTLETLDWSITNPATGPIYIEGTKPGDLLRIDLHEVKATGSSVMIAVPNVGALGHLITSEETAILENRGDMVVFKDKVVVKQNAMLGVIGVAPAAGEVHNSTPGTHGGNMDCTLITSGSRLYLSVAVEGALFGCGDMHAAMGDGEVVVCGAETPGEVRLTPQVVDLAGLPTPFIENDELVAVIASAESLDDAYKLALDMMHEFLTKVAGLPVNDAAMLMSLVGDLKFCQVVDPLLTVRFEFPKSVLADYGFSMPA
ncbi:MAG: acetamidase/formamidase family protein [Coriobacteriia bacterium]|nr:acetamidase/formamidase family protein [Coriobacteriia bacterium]MBN2823147.1 acetamidase/formamidase family protein [Coriobacteriia bacterium]